MPAHTTQYRFVEFQNQKWMKCERGKIPTRDLNLPKFSKKLQNQAPWGSDDLKDTSEEGKLRAAIQEVLKKWTLDSTVFNPQLEDKSCQK